MNSIKVLLVDDEVEFTDVLVERLQARGITAVATASGEAAIAAAGHQQFDAVLLDMAMPGMDGIETLQRLRDLKADLQVVLLTGKSTPRQAADAMKFGAMDLLEKPTDIEQLLGVIENAAARTSKLSEERAEGTLKDILRKKGW